MIVTAKLDFAAAHRLNNPARDAAWNRDMYDKCDNPAGHGHNYIIEVSVRGSVNPETGMVIDLKRLKEIVRDRVINHVDHKHLNEDVAFLRGVIPTAENLAMAFWEQLEPAIDQGGLHEIVLHETGRNSVSFKGQQDE